MIDFAGSGEAAGLTFAADVAIRATLFLMLALAAHALLGRRQARARSALWNAAVAGLLVLPWACAGLPRARIAALPARAVARPAATLRFSDAPEAPRHAARALEPSSVADRVSIGGPDQTPGATSAHQNFAAAVVPLRSTGPIAPPRVAARRPIAMVVLGIYGTIAMILLMRLAGSLIVVGRLRGTARPIASPDWSEAFDRCRAWVGAPRRTRLLVSDAVSVPLAVGWLRPAVIVPRALAETRDAHLIDAVLVHELGHVRRGDFAWNVALRLARIVYWPHPLVWPVGRLVRDAREQACDDLCVFALGGARAYRASLIAVAAGMVRRHETALGMAMAHATRLGRRLSWIDHTPGAPRCLPRRNTRLLLALLNLAAIIGIGTIEPAPARAVPQVAQEVKTKPRSDAGSARQEAPKPSEKPAATPSAIEVVVRSSADGRPLPGAKIRASLDLTPLELKTDRAGRARIDLSNRSFQGALSLDVWADDHVQQRYDFNQHDRRHPRIPAQFAIDLLPGEQTLGGKVISEEGKPIAGATVVIQSYIDKKEPHELAYLVDARTDERGEWRCRCFRNAKSAFLYVSHPDYLSDPARPFNRPLQPLLDFSDVQTMKRGAELSGTVSDQAGKPVAGAEVGWIDAKEQFAFHDALARTATGQDGRFRFPHARPGELMLQFKARGHAPEMKTVKLDANAAPLNVSVALAPARVLSGRVVDMHDRPIAGVLVNADAWRGYRALGVHMYTDQEGRFRWDGAPEGPVAWNFTKLGYVGVFRRPISAEDGEVSVRLKRSLEISGRLHDAATNEPIDVTARVEVGVVDPKTGNVSWGTSQGAFSFLGRLQASIDVENASAFRLRIQAETYEPFESRIFRREEGVVQFDPPLSKAKAFRDVAVQGTIARPGGAPLAGAEVAVTYPVRGNTPPMMTVRVENGKIVRHEGLRIAKTDERGRFTLAREPGPGGDQTPWGIVAVHPDFYAEADSAVLAKNPTIAARPWGRVEGFARIGRGPAANMAVGYEGARLDTPDVPYFPDSATSQTDARGHFAIDHVVPGEGRVARRFDDSHSIAGRTRSSGVLVTVQAGKTTQVKLGGRGRPVVARIVPPPGADQTIDYTVHSWFTIESDRPSAPFPRELVKRGRDATMDWFQTWYGSEEGRAYRRDHFQLWMARLESNEALRAEDVPPGEYRLSLVYSADPVQGPSGRSDHATYATKQFRVPEGQSDRPLDLGELRPRPRQVLKVGAPAPAFDVETLAGRRVKLEDFHGKYLLLDFWATWCGPCVAELPDLKALFERFRVDERFAVLGLSLDEDQDAPRRFAAARGMRWAQGFLGQGDKGGVADAYRVETIPAFVLIGPDGKIRAQARHAEEIADVVAHALSAP